MRLIMVIVASLAAALAPINAAEAATNATQKDHIEVRHYSPDAGYDRDLLLRCSNQGFVIIEGTSSTRFRHVRFGPDCEGVTSVYVRSGEEWWRKLPSGWDKSWDATGWHNLPKGWSDGAGVTLRKD